MGAQVLMGAVPAPPSPPFPPGEHPRGPGLRRQQVSILLEASFPSELSQHSRKKHGFFFFESDLPTVKFAHGSF